VIRMTARSTLNRALATAVVVAFALLVAACGGSSSSKSGSASGGASGADAAPADAAAFVSVNTDLSSSQWKTVDQLLSKFPGKDKTLADMRKSFETDSGLNWETDVKPALGPEVDFVALDLSNNGGGVALTQPKDQGKFDALVAKANAKKSGSIVSEKVGDWTVLSDKQASIDAYKTRASGKKLSDDATFKTAMGELSGDALAKVLRQRPPGATGFAESRRRCCAGHVRLGGRRARRAGRRRQARRNVQGPAPEGSAGGRGVRAEAARERAVRCAGRP